MNRREFIAGLGSAAAWPAADPGAAIRQVPTIGFLGPASASAMKPWATAFVAAAGRTRLE